MGTTTTHRRLPSFSVLSTLKPVTGRPPSESPTPPLCFSHPHRQRSRGLGSAQFVASAAGRWKANSKSPADPAPNSSELLYSAPAQNGSPHRTPAVCSPVLSFFEAPYFSEPPILRPPTAVQGRRIHIAEMPGVLRNEPAPVPARWPCADPVGSAAFAPWLPTPPAAHRR